MQSSMLLARGAPAMMVPRALHHAPLPAAACSTSGLRCALVVPSSRRSLAALRTRATNNGSSNGTPSTTTTATDGNVSDVEDCAENLAGEYCTLDDSGKRVKGKRTIGEMENDFLSALSSWYYDGKPAMNDDEFELLKDELLWAGSKVPILDGDEKRFLEASMAYAKGKPIMNDDEYDSLKASLKMKSSVVAAEGPRCSIRSKKMYSDATPDYLKMTLLNIPGAMFILGVLFGIDLLTGLEVSALIQLPPPYGVALLWGLVLPVLFVISYGLTQIGFKDNIILKGPCPNCGSESFTYFGDIFTVPGNRGQNQVECSSCKAGLSFDENKRIIVVDEMPEERIKRAAAAAAKKAAAAAKKKSKVTASMDNN